jgi:hypothetical protein
MIHYSDKLTLFHRTHMYMCRCYCYCCTHDWLKQIINVAKSPRTPGLAIYLSSDSEQDQESAKKVVDMLEYITLGDITVATQVRKPYCTAVQHY